MKKSIHIIVTALLYILIAAIAVFGISALVQKQSGAKLPMTFGWGNAVVLTGSMEPAIPVRSMVIIHDTDNIKKGDVVTYVREGSQWPVTHRITYIEGNTVITKGDVNNAEDSPFHKQDILGKVIFTLPPGSIPILILLGSFLLYIAFTISQKTKPIKENPKDNERAAI